MSTHYPLIAWTVDGTGTVVADGPGGTAAAESLNQSALLGWDPTQALGDTIASTLVDAIDAGFGTHGMSTDGLTYRTSAFDVGVVSYECPFPRYQIAIDAGTPTSTAPTLTFSSAAVALQFGFTSASVNAVPVGATPTADWAFVTDATPDGVLSFGTVSRDYDDVPGYNASRTRSPHNPSAFVTIQHSSIQRWPIVWKGAPMRHKSRYYAALADFASVAGTSTADTNGTLQGLIDADQDDNNAFLVWLDSSTAKQVSLDWAGPVVSVDTFAVQSAFGNQRMDVSLPFIEVA